MENTLSENTLSENTLSEIHFTENQFLENILAENKLSVITLSKNLFSEKTLSENTIRDADGMEIQKYDQRTDRHTWVGTRNGCASNKWHWQYWSFCWLIPDIHDICHQDHCTGLELFLLG